MRFFGGNFTRLYPTMALITRPGFSANTEVEASSFSVWNCVITFLQILLVSTMLYGAGWNQGQMYNISPDHFMSFHHFRAIAFFFCVWALQSVALALLLVWAIGKRSYHLCHSWVLCEALMQVFIVLSFIYFAYRSFLETPTSSSSPRLLSDSNEDPAVSDMMSLPPHSSHPSFSPPKHFAFLVILHFLIKGFGFWIVWRYMKLLKTTNIQTIDSHENGPTSNTGSSSHRQTSPPPSYACLCKDDLPCYDEAMKLCLKDTADIKTTKSTNDRLQDDSQNAFVSSPV